MRMAAMRGCPELPSPKNRSMMGKLWKQQRPSMKLARQKRNRNRHPAAHNRKRVALTARLVCKEF
jgi:hypothetical protein